MRHRTDENRDTLGAVAAGQVSVDVSVQKEKLLAESVPRTLQIMVGVK